MTPQDLVGQTIAFCGLSICLQQPDISERILKV